MFAETIAPIILARVTLAIAISFGLGLKSYVKEQFLKCGRIQERFKYKLYSNSKH